MDHTEVFRGAEVTGDGGNSARAALTALCRGMEGGFQILYDLLVDSTIDHGIDTKIGCAD